MRHERGRLHRLAGWLEEEAGADIELSYAVWERAGEGIRALRLQQGSTQLRLADVVQVVP